MESFDVSIFKSPVTIKFSYVFVIWSKEILSSSKKVCLLVLRGGL